MPCAIFLPIFGELSEPRLVADLSAEAEAAGWDGVFVWDHMLYRPTVTHIADPWITLAAMATATERVRIGPMVTPLPRRRPHKVARECVSLDRLSGGRVTFGVGMGGDPGGELTKLGEELDPKVRGRMLDEGLDVLVGLWSGEEVRHQGERYVADAARMLPTALQQPRIPIWVAARYGNVRPLRRAARYEGLFPIGVDHPDQLAGLLDVVREHRTTDGPYDVIVSPDAGAPDAPAWLDAGATWWAHGFDAFTVDAASVRAVIADGPPV